jgi:uncharacterized protein
MPPSFPESIDMSVLSFVLDLLLGVVLGVTGGLFGIGGGLIAIPILGLFFGLDQQMAQGTALVMVVPNVVLAVWRYNQHNRIDLTHSAALAVPGFFLLALAVYMLIRLLRGSAKGGTTLRHGLPALAALGAVAGVMGGLMAVGSAVVATPGLTGIFGASQVVAQGLSLALALPSTCVTLIVYAWHGQVDWMLGVPLAIGGLLSISWGVKLAHTLPERLLRALFCGFLTICAVALYLK